MSKRIRTSTTQDRSLVSGTLPNRMTQVPAPVLGLFFSFLGPRERFAGLGLADHVLRRRARQPTNWCYGPRAKPEGRGPLGVWQWTGHGGGVPVKVWGHREDARAAMPRHCHGFGRAVDFIVIVSPALADALRFERGLEATIERCESKAVLGGQALTLQETAEYQEAQRGLKAATQRAALEERIARYGAFEEEGVSAHSDVV